jgi:tetratricopeptide (TPR) repeat protein
MCSPERTSGGRSAIAATMLGSPVADRTKTLLVLAREHYDRRDYDRAEHLLKQVLARVDRYADVHHLAAMIARERGDFVKASEHLERAVAINPRYTEALLALAITYNDLGRYDESREVRERLAAAQAPQAGALAEDLDPFVLGKIANQHAALAQAYKDAGCFEDALRELGRAVELRPGFVDLRVKLAALLRDAGRVDEAIEQLIDACARRPSYVEGRVQLGLAYYAAGNRKEAREALRAALAIDPDHDRAKTYARVFGASDEP